MFAKMMYLCMKALSRGYYYRTAANRLIPRHSLRSPLCDKKKRKHYQAVLMPEERVNKRRQVDKYAPCVISFGPSQRSKPCQSLENQCLFSSCIQYIEDCQIGGLLLSSIYFKDFSIIMDIIYFY